MVRMTKSGRGLDGQPHLALPPLLQRQVLVYMHEQDRHQYLRLLKQQQNILMERKVEAALAVSVACHLWWNLVASTAMTCCCRCVAACVMSKDQPYCKLLCMLCPATGTLRAAIMQ